MLKWILHKAVDGATKRFNYDAAYLHEILEATTPGFLKFLLAQPLSRHDGGLPVAVHYAARVVAVRAEDCGPCAQLVVEMARQDGVPAPLLRAIVARDFAALPAEVVEAMRFTDAVLAHAPADALRAALVDRFGEHGLVALAFAIAQTRTYPTIKRVLGHAQTCERLRVDGELVDAARAPAGGYGVA
ncbi:MAG: hypothetical protein H6993_03330 [Pseudomonadales bacterium]|nr:hypothetical protein [Pseudomonadales bacterium]MCP5182965.1 hypothetical protein [Pseudomonadales bacterium]